MWYRWEDDELILRLHVQPKAARDAFTGPHGEYFKVRITAPPVEGRANEYLVRFLAKAFGVPKRQVSLVSGQGSRNKTFHIKAPRKRPLPIDNA